MSVFSSVPSKVLPRSYRKRARSKASDIYCASSLAMWSTMTKAEVKQFVTKRYYSNIKIELSQGNTPNVFGSVILSILISLFIKAVVELLWYWISNSVELPSIYYLPSEPGWFSGVNR